MEYIPNTPEDRKEMLRVIGVQSFDELISHVPAAVRLTSDLNLSAPMSELEVLRELKSLSSMNASTDDFVSFLGAGAYDHFIPSVVPHILSRSEF
ncbi:MAG: glycine dehydrogenase, partial [Nitrospira sp.]|nr:glycine dehydrogenase [Nitrospira sp.]